MQVRYYMDPETGELHIYRHSVSEEEVEQILVARRRSYAGAAGARHVIGKTESGRYLKVVFRLGADESIFVVTAYPPTQAEIRAYRRRKRKKP